ncbi:MAG TPA: flagellin [Gemmatimonadaceae bacterium]|jgi:flagellin
MRINTNVSAIMAANNLSKVQDAVSASMEKLSSGFRINKAADDAAGLGIANTLRADGQALSQASRNADQTTSLLQVAEGGTSTIESILERMKELATQSASDTVDAAGRSSINAEFTALRSEIDRTVSTTTFQGGSLLDGTFGTIAGALSKADISVPANGTSTAGNYSLAVSGNVVTLSGPSSRSDSVDLSTLTSADYSSGKVNLKFGSGTSQITIAVVADNANDITSVSNTLNLKGFSIQAGAAATHQGAQLSPAAGVTIGTIGSGISDGTYTFSATDHTVTQGGSQAGVSGVVVQPTATAGIYSIAVSDQSITSSITGSAVKAGTLAVTTATPADAYVLKVSGSAGATKVDMYASTDTSFATSLGSTTIGAYTNAADLNITLGGVSFTVDHTAVADLAALGTDLDGKTVTVTAAKIDIKDSSNSVVTTQNLSSGYTAGGNIAFSSGDFALNVSGANANTDTWTEIKAALQATTITTADAHIDVKDSLGATVATQSYHSYASGATLNFSQGSGTTAIGFSVSAGANTSFAAVKAALESSPLSVTTTAAGANDVTDNSITGNSTLRQANFMVDSSGQYKTNDMLQLDALNLTVANLGLANADLGTESGAQAALSTIDTAMGTVSTALGSIGANQNRISYAQDNLKTKIANFSAAESVIRDVDMADEMTTFSKNNILAQAGTAMLAQANQSGQSVLKLLQ